MKSDIDTVLPKSGKGLSVALWITQILLAALFVFAGVMKFIMPMKEMTKQNSLPPMFIYFIGVVEILGGIGLILPALLRILPMLTPLAACGLVVIMAGATVMSMPMGLMALFPFVTGVMCIFVCYGRLRMRPISSRD